MRTEQAKALVEAAVAAGEVPGAVACAGSRERVVLLAACGATRLETPEAAPVTAKTLFDLASLTKVVATLPALLRLVENGEIVWDDPVRRFFANAGWFQTPSVAEATIRQLLTHTAGLPTWKPLFAVSDSRTVLAASVLQSELAHTSGEVVYSDLGFMLLGLIIERVSGLRQDVFVARYVHEPLGMDQTRYGPIGGEVAATEHCGWRNAVLCGVVHDENAYAMGGVAGHAGLFAPAEDLARYAQAWLNFDPRLGSEALLREAIREQVRDAAGARRALGWQLSAPGSSAGRYAGAAAFGHTGFTGTSLWLDPDQGWFGVLLTNRVHPSRFGGQRISSMRVAFHEALSEAP
jgi:CubicO group peptidase (beta-lactamase class C family)